MTGFDPEGYLDSLEPVGWKLGLDRMHRLNTALGMPQHRFASVHVVGTNGKSSVTRMIAALLGAHGLSAGACVSPHPSRWAERVLLHGEQIGEAAFAAAVERTAEAASLVNRSLVTGFLSGMRRKARLRPSREEEVTQFEVATAAAFVAFAAAHLDVAVIEAGLGGRLDATNTIPSRVTVLTSVGLDHTEWLGETEEEIATEKLDVLRDGTTLVLGRVGPAVAELAERTAAARGAMLIRAPEDPGEAVELLAAGRFQRRNFALALAAAEAFLGELDPVRVSEVAATLTVPGRLERVGADPSGGEAETPQAVPLVLLDAAHNPDGAEALAEALPEVAEGPVVACLAILADKDAEAMIAALAPALERAVCTQLPDFPAAGPKTEKSPRFSAHRRSTPAAELAAACERAGLSAETEPDFEAALRRARALAAGPPPRTLLVTGSHYVLGTARAVLSR